MSAGSFGRQGAVRQGSGSVQTLTLDDAKALQEQVPTIGRLTPVVRGRAQVVAGNTNWNTSIEGGNEDYLTVRNWPIVSGANFTPRDGSNWSTAFTSAIRPSCSRSSGAILCRPSRSARTS